jgi:cytochrome c-type biogenesis protein
MLEALLTYLSTALAQSLFLALFGAFLWGVTSILLSPCHLASVPLLVGFLTMHAKSGSKRAFQLSLLFSVGTLMAIALLGVVTASAGRILGNLGKTGNAAVALIFLVFGIALGPCTFAFMAPVLGVVFSRAGSNPGNAIGLLGAFALGHCGVIVLAGTLTQSVERYLGWSENHQTLKWLRRFCGLLVLGAGIYLLRRSLSAF